MKSLFFLILIFIVQVSSTYIFLSNYLPPTDSSGKIIYENFYFAASSIGLGVALFFAIVHTCIDKLFFRKIGESFRYILGLRRGLMVGVTLTFYLIFKEWGFRDLQYVYALGGIFVLIEVLLMILF